MSTNHHTALADDASLNHTTTNTISAAIDSQLTDMDDGTHNYSAINVDGGNIDGATFGAGTPGPATVTNLLATSNLWGPAIQVTMGGSTQNISSTATTTVEFDSEVLDSNSDFNTGTYTMTPTVEGWYYALASVVWTAAWNANKLMQLLIVGSNETSYSSLETVGTVYRGITACGIHYCNGSSDTLLVQVYNGDSVTRTILGNTYQTWFSVWRIQ